METFWRHGKKRIALNCGTFKRLDKYAESLSCEHGNGMTPTVVLFPDKRKIVPFEYYEDAIIYKHGLGT